MTHQHSMDFRPNSTALAPTARAPNRSIAPAGDGDSKRSGGWANGDQNRHRQGCSTPKDCSLDEYRGRLYRSAGLTMLALLAMAGMGSVRSTVIQRRAPVLSTHGRRSTSMQASAVMKHRKLAAVLAAVLFAGSASTGLAQGTRGARAPSPGIGGGGTGFAAPSPGIGTGGMAPSLTPTPGIGTGSPTNITPTPGIGTTPNPAGALTGGPSSAGPPGERHSERKGSERRACERRAAPHPRGHQGGNRGRSHLPTMSSQRQISERAQMCLGLPGFPFYRPYRPPKQP